MPATIAVTALPRWLNASLHPIRRLKTAQPKMPRLMASTAGGKTASARPAAARAIITGQNKGTSAVIVTAIPTISALAAIKVRFRTVASTNAPAGRRASTVAMPATVRTAPMRPAVHCWLAIR